MSALFRPDVTERIQAEQILRQSEAELREAHARLGQAYDALTHDRPYRLAWSHQEACRYLVEQSGKHFDPAIVDVFLKLLS
jgi:putative two-component system response regulator